MACGVNAQQRQRRVLESVGTIACDKDAGTGSYADHGLFGVKARRLPPRLPEAADPYRIPSQTALAKSRS